MSVQHRSRIRTVADYGTDFSDVGSCCYPPEHELYDYENQTVPVDDVTYQECVSEGGYFLPEGGLCPNLSLKGCCCSCSFVDDFEAFLDNPGPNYGSGCPDTSDPLSCYQGGLKEVTLCECNSLGGIWSTSPCSYYYDEDNEFGVGSYILCDPMDDEDIRFPWACCSENIDGNCQNACTVSDCQGLIGDEDSAIFYDGVGQCDDDLPECGNSSGGEFVKRYRNYPNIIIGEEIMNMQTRDNEKSCCVYEKDSAITCERLVKYQCDSVNGMFAGFDVNLQSQRSTDSVCTDIQNYMSNDKSSISSSVVSGWSVGQKVLNLGVYVGTFNVKNRNNPNSPTAYGNSETGPAQEFKPETQKHNSESDDKYAIIVYPTDIMNVQMQDKILRTSDIYTDNTMWDTNENHNKSSNVSLVKHINTISGNNNWVIPSHDVMSFVYGQMDTPDFLVNTTIEDNNPNLIFNNLQNDFYWTSSIMAGTDSCHYYIHRGDFVAGCQGIMRHPVRLVLQLKIN